MTQQPYSWTQVGWVGAFRRWYDRQNNAVHGVVWVGGSLLLAALVFGVGLAIRTAPQHRPGSATDWHNASTLLVRDLADLQVANQAGDLQHAAQLRENLIRECQGDATLQPLAGNDDEQTVRTGCALVDVAVP